MLTLTEVIQSVIFIIFRIFPQVTKNLFDMGCYEVSLGDTIGVGTPGLTQLFWNKTKKKHYLALNAVFTELDAFAIADHSSMQDYFFRSM